MSGRKKTTLWRPRQTSRSWRTARCNWLTALACCLALSAITQAAERPNIVVLLADDSGWGDLSVNGNTNIRTPHIDSLARDGASIERFFVCPVCSPTRAEFLTGRYHPRGGVWSTSTGGERLNLDERTIGDVFRAAGYATGAFGKWHNGTQWPYHPNARGFAEFHGFCSGHWGHYFDPVLEHNGQTVRGRGFIADDFTDQALQFIDRHQRDPFFCYVPFNTPHSPMQVPENSYERFRDAPISQRYEGNQSEDLAMTRAALAMMENLDANVGRILTRLDELKLNERTIVLYFTDNGPNSWRWNGGMKGRKASTDEGGVRSPLLIRWPGRIKSGLRVSQIAAAIDLLPTLAELSDVPVPAANDKPLDGRSLAPLLLEKKEPWPDRLLFSYWAGKLSVRSQQYRLDMNGKLFDPAADPAQEHDLSKTRPEVTAQLTAAAHQWRRDVVADLGLRDGRPFTVGYREFPITQLPARDGVAQGTIRRSARAPNCSFFENWTSVNDRLSWQVEVHTPGKYEATIHYTCPASDLGSQVELSFGGRRLLGTVEKAHDPPLVGAAFDRVPREGESQVKDFAPLTLGTFTLPAERGALSLRALSVAGQRVMDVRGITLKLVD